MSDSSTVSDPFHGRISETEALDIFGVRIRILMPVSVTDGALSIFEDHNDPGAGPPLHVHHDADEIFAVIAGSYRFICNQNVIKAGAGDIVLVPRGAPHTFLNCGTGAGHLLVTMRPGGFEDFFRTVADAKLEVPRDMSAIADIARRYHLEFLGPIPLAGREST